MLRSRIEQNIPLPDTPEDFLTRGVYALAIDRLPADSHECPICLIGYNEPQDNRPAGEGAVLIRRCGHAIGWECLKRQVAMGADPRRCPMCRDSLYALPERRTAPASWAPDAPPRPPVRASSTVLQRTRARDSEPASLSIRDYVFNIPEQAVFSFIRLEYDDGTSPVYYRVTGYMMPDGSGVASLRDNDNTALQYPPGTFSAPNAGATQTNGDYLIITHEQVAEAAARGNGAWDADLNLDFLMEPGPVLCIWESEDRYISPLLIGRNPNFRTAINAPETNIAITLMDRLFESRRVRQYLEWRMKGSELRNLLMGAATQVETQFNGLPEHVWMYLEAVVEILVNWLAFTNGSR
ncbi:uncharacterized protein K452DRAFT_42314 [Aplosporella prunicola CBS 121167]|uniref:RING-type domain-containing protein n=1 Tax=Aplosporella prunicola CBS 121167 TaxID=1176127 RepID=A0A6A6BDB0_9PEZI|nr:uncharacterized protein K452DRAFT_42314 [Aplosporella prunicola CBS 121167]KAF2140887.1 hypothetical protein K452DRAFT_42314 [Aplosporella prunicola CBS 121167]